MFSSFRMKLPDEIECCSFYTEMGYPETGAKSLVRKTFVLGRRLAGDFA
jgi:hypothetical protein